MISPFTSMGEKPVETHYPGAKLSLSNLRNNSYRVSNQSEPLPMGFQGFGPEEASLLVREKDHKLDAIDLSVFREKQPFILKNNGPVWLRYAGKVIQLLGPDFVMPFLAPAVKTVEVPMSDIPQLHPFQLHKLDYVNFNRQGVTLAQAGDLPLVSVTETCSLGLCKMGKHIMFGAYNPLDPEQSVLVVGRSFRQTDNNMIPVANGIISQTEATRIRTTTSEGPMWLTFAVNVATKSIGLTTAHLQHLPV